nr:dna-directed rna polymerase ii subunit rpb9 [Quercus suber]
MLYPNEENNELLFVCKSCNYKEPAVNALTYRNALKEEVQETAGNILDVAQDPTVGNDLSAQAYLREQTRSDDGDLDFDGDSAMDVDMDIIGEDAVPEMCTLCAQEILCPVCGGPSGNGIALETEDPSDEDPQKQADMVELERRERALSGAAPPATYTSRS